MFSSFMTNTWIVASIVAAVAGFVGFFVVIRGASFAAHALPLGAFPGAAAASPRGPASSAPTTAKADATGNAGGCKKE